MVVICMVNVDGGSVVQTRHLINIRQPLNALWSWLIWNYCVRCFDGYHFVKGFYLLRVPMCYPVYKLLLYQHILIYIS